MRKLPTVLAAMRDDFLGWPRDKTGTLHTNQMDQLVLRTKRNPQAAWYSRDSAIFTIEYRDSQGNDLFDAPPGPEAVVVHHRRISDQCYPIELANPNSDDLKALQDLIDDSVAPKPKRSPKP
jgi:hypothetical protein